HRHHLRVLAVLRRGGRRPELRDARDAELRQGRAVADGPCRARRAGRPVPERPGGCGQVVRELGPRPHAPTNPDTGRRLVTADDPPAALRLAEEVLERALRVGATEAEVLVLAGDSALTRFANNEIHQNVAERSVTVNLRYVVGRRIAVVSTGKVDAVALRTLVHRGAAIARSCEELEDW